MTSNAPGWVQRVFGVKDLEEKLASTLSELDAKTSQIAELEREAPELRRAAEQAASELGRLRNVQQEREKTFAASERELALLRSSLAEAQTQLKDEEARLQAETERAATAGKAMTAANRRAEKRLAEIDGLKRQKEAAESRARDLETSREGLQRRLAEVDALSGKLAAAETRARALDVRCDELTGQLASRESALAKSAEQLERSQAEARRAQAALASARAKDGEREGLERGRASLEGELSKTRAELEAQNQAAEALRNDQAERTRRLEAALRENSRNNELLEDRETLVTDTRRALIDVLCLSARALDMAFGSSAHLALELAMPPPERTPKGPAETTAEDPVLRVRERLTLLGVADNFSAEKQGEALTCRFKLLPRLDPADVVPVARWLACYALECLSGTTYANLRLDAFSGGPEEFVFVATPREVPGAKNPRKVSAPAA